MADRINVRYLSRDLPWDLDNATFRCVIDASVAAARLVPAIATPGNFDPAALMPLAVRHRLAAPVLERLAEVARAVDPAASEALATRGRQQRFAAIARARQLVDVSRALSSGGIRHLMVKGAVLAEQLYGDVAARDSKDIDLLIDPRQLDAAFAILWQLGDREPVGPAAAGDKHGPKHHSFWIAGTEIEAHSRLLDTDDYVSLPFHRLWERRVTVPFGRVPMQALSSVDTLLYLCAHGTEHCWFRLKWLQDIARIVVIDESGIVAAAMERAEREGYDRIVAAALQLVRELFGIAPNLAGTIDLPTRRLVTLSKAALAAPADLASDPTLGWLVRRAGVQIGLRRAWRGRGAFLHHLFTGARSFDADRGQASWLNYLRRPARLLQHHYARGTAHWRR